MKKLGILFVFLFVVAFTVTSCKKDKSEEAKKEVKKEVKKEIATVVYQCPMDCEKGKSYSKVGSCPVCKMDLKEKKPEDTKAEEHKNEDGHGHEH